MTSRLKHVTIFTDGCCLGNPGLGGYAAVLLYGNHRKELFKGFRLTTNNRMEIMATIAGLEALRFPCNVTLNTDSEYVIFGAGSAEQWRKDGWRLNPPKAKKAANRDLWKWFLGARGGHEVAFHWVKGHAQVAENERCDQLAKQAAEGTSLDVDTGFETQNPSIQPLTVEEISRAKRLAAANPKITQEGQPCRKCGEPVERRVPRRSIKPGQTYYFAYYLACPRCGAMYMVEEAKRRVNGN